MRNVSTYDDFWVFWAGPSFGTVGEYAVMILGKGLDLFVLA